MSKQIIYEGGIIERSYGEADDILFLGDADNPLAETLEDDREHYGPYATVRYYVSETEQTKDRLDENLIRQVSGDTEADFGSHYSEYTGYLWTNEKFKVGGHDLLGELHDHAGQFLYMEIEWQKEPKS
jgi:hypothetical protein